LWFYNRLGMPVATGRLLEHVPGVAKIGRMAVRRALRGSRVGRAELLQALVDARGDRRCARPAQR
jgi:predicted GNAT family N-acyltransferase